MYKIFYTQIKIISCMHANKRSINANRYTCMQISTNTPSGKCLHQRFIPLALAELDHTSNVGPQFRFAGLADLGPSRSVEIESANPHMLLVSCRVFGLDKRWHD